MKVIDAVNFTSSSIYVCILREQSHLLGDLAETFMRPIISLKLTQIKIHGYATKEINDFDGNKGNNSIKL